MFSKITITCKETDLFSGAMVNNSLIDYKIKLWNTDIAQGNFCINDYEIMPMKRFYSASPTKDPVLRVTKITFLSHTRAFKKNM